MKDAEYNEQKARVERYTERWLIPLGLDAWHVDVCWHREKDDDDTRPSGRPAMMSTEVRWQYCDATIHVYLPSVAEVPDDDVLEKIVVHEYMHILLHEMRPYGKTIPNADLAHEEHCATVLAMAFMRLRDYVWPKESPAPQEESGELPEAPPANDGGAREAAGRIERYYVENTGPYGEELRTGKLFGGHSIG